MASQAKPKLVAIVDDDPSVRCALQSLMKAAGLSANSFASAKEFFDSSQQCQTAYIITDIRMPGMSGPDLQEKLNTESCPIPTTFITAHRDTKMRNTRELHNSIERATILANDEVFPNLLSASRLTTVSAPTAVSHTLRDSEPAVPRKLRDAERALILQTLDATGWVIGGFQRRSRTELASIVIYEGQIRELRITNSLNPVKLKSEARLSLCSI